MLSFSDDRSAELFKKKLEETTQMKSVLGPDHRPNCLIIDEIDGAPSVSVALAFMRKAVRFTGDELSGSVHFHLLLEYNVACHSNVPSLATDFKNLSLACLWLALLLWLDHNCGFESEKVRLQSCCTSLQHLMIFLPGQYFPVENGHAVASVQDETVHP